MSELSNLLVKLSSTLEDINKLQEQTTSFESLKNDDAKAKYYTGLPSYKVFCVLIKYVKPFVKYHGKTAFHLKIKFY